MRRAVAGLSGRQAPPAADAREPVRAVAAPAALDAQPGRAVAGAGAGRAGRQGAPARVHDDALVGSTGNADSANPGGAGDSRPGAAPGAPSARADRQLAHDAARLESVPGQRPPGR